jgi:hypothetical protein
VACKTHSFSTQGVRTDPGTLTDLPRPQTYMPDLSQPTHWFKPKYVCF